MHGEKKCTRPLNGSLDWAARGGEISGMKGSLLTEDSKDVETGLQNLYFTQDF